MQYDWVAKKIAVERPFSVEIYNRLMGGVDKADMLLSLYRTHCRSQKWYHRIEFHLLSLAAVNTWLLCQRMGANEPFVKFLGKICFSLIKGSAQPIEYVEENSQPGVYRSLTANGCSRGYKI